MTELKEHIDKGDLVEFFTTGDNLTILTTCVEPNMEIDDDYEFKDGEMNSELQKSIAVEMCTKAIMDDPEMDGAYTKEQADIYCNCTIEGLFSIGVTYEELETLDYENQVLFNELVIPCVGLAFAGGDGLDYIETPVEVLGVNKIEDIPIVNLAGNGFNVKIGFGDVERYFTIDSGASDVIIDSKLEKILLDAGEISAQDYGGFTTYSLTDGSTVQCQMLTIRLLTIGNFKVHNVQAAIMPGGSLLLGQSLLMKFTSWKIVSEKEVLVLEN
ncbi:MAG: retroviral-like aspartic protease family protein [Crocinitomicaceae bacterium]|nr:retroviral-like aspartic protease family protein [Crocinitomicaceae bacterium]